MMLDRHSHYFAIAALTLFLACGTPTFETDLVTAGPPEVTLVNVASEAADEAATYCGAPKRNLLYCPEEGSVDTVTDAPLQGLFVRVAFDELLDPSIETIDPETSTGSIVAANPATLQCGGTAVTYDGFYQPSGSHLTDPPGPALVFEVSSPVAGGADCTIELAGTIVDKAGNAVPQDSRGPYSFSLAPFTLVGTNPQDGTEGLEEDTVVAVIFNNLVDEATLAGRVTVEDGGGAVAVDVSVDEMAGDTVIIAPSAGTFALETTYTVTLTSGILDVGGASYEPTDGAFSFTFTTGN